MGTITYKAAEWEKFIRENAKKCVLSSRKYTKKTPRGLACSLRVFLHLFRNFSLFFFFKSSVQKVYRLAKQRDLGADEEGVDNCFPEVFMRPKQRNEGNYRYFHKGKGNPAPKLFNKTPQKLGAFWCPCHGRNPKRQSNCRINSCNKRMCFCRFICNEKQFHLF